MAENRRVSAPITAIYFLRSLLTFRQQPVCILHESISLTDVGQSKEGLPTQTVTAVLPLDRQNAGHGEFGGNREYVPPRVRRSGIAYHG